MVKVKFPTTEELKNQITTIQVSKETLRQLKLRKTILDFDSFDELINYMLKCTPNEYVLDRNKRPVPCVAIKAIKGDD